MYTLYAIIIATLIMVERLVNVLLRVFNRRPWPSLSTQSRTSTYDAYAAIYLE